MVWKPHRTLIVSCTTNSNNTTGQTQWKTQMLPTRIGISQKCQKTPNAYLLCVLISWVSWVNSKLFFFSSNSMQKFTHLLQMYVHPWTTKEQWVTGEGRVVCKNHTRRGSSKLHTSAPGPGLQSEPPAARLDIARHPAVILNRPDTTKTNVCSSICTDSLDILVIWTSFRTYLKAFDDTNDNKGLSLQIERQFVWTICQDKENLSMTS